MKFPVPDSYSVSKKDVVNFCGAIWSVFRPTDVTAIQMMQLASRDPGRRLGKLTKQLLGSDDGWELLGVVDWTRRCEVAEYWLPLINTCCCCWSG